MKDFLITLAWVIGSIVVLAFLFIFLMRGFMELAVEYRAFTGSTASTIQSQNPTTTERQNTQTNYWKQFVPLSGDFSVDLPRTPRTTVKSTPQAILNTYATTDGGEYYEVNRLHLTESVEETSLEDVTIFLTNFAESHSLVIEEILPETENGMVHFTVEGDEKLGKGEMFVIDDFTIFILLYTCERNSCSEENQEAFVASFDV